MKINNRRILLIGAAGGIGQAIAREFDKLGAKIMLADRDEVRLKQLQRELPGEHRVVVADITSSKGREEIFEQCRHHGLDIYINAAGVLDFNMFDKQDPEKVERMMSINLVSPMLLCRKIIPLLPQGEEAIIVNIGSIFGSIGHPGYTAYCASKFGLRGFSEALRRELADTSVKVVYLAPRATGTGLNSNAVTELNKELGNATDTPEQVVRKLMKMLSAGKKQYFIGWPEKLFVVINSLFPGIVHHALAKKLPIIRQYAES